MLPASVSIQHRIGTINAGRDIATWALGPSSIPHPEATHRCRCDRATLFPD